MKAEIGHVGKTWQLTGADGKRYDSAQAGSLGGHRRSRIYGRLDCRAALQAIARGGYIAQRVFFLHQADAEAAGYRPCAVCLPQEYAVWKKNKNLIDSRK
ncbi:MAG: Ada metal-binding domain-containing protein [Collimonas pratensis]|uniref:Ada metal-binding domain-containing protein n=1 Tax=Collimonas pratensis TaxID=279113 RepID=UPI003C723B8C